MTHKLDPQPRSGFTLQPMLFSATPITAFRLKNQKLVQSNLRHPADVVSWLGAVQAQDLPAAKWALGLRARGVTEADVDRAYDEGVILRTHVLRPTWHFVAPADIRWMLALTAPRVHAANAYYERQLELDAPVLARSRKALERALRDGHAKTRKEIGAVLERAGIPAARGTRLAHLMAHAELEGLVVSGPRRGKQFTYALLEERVPAVPILDRDEALSALTRRYFASHGPATLRDYAWWSGLTARTAGTGIEIARADLSERVIDGLPYWLVPSRAAARRPSSSVRLLPNYDEYFVAYKDGRTGDSRELAHQLVIDGKSAGSWKRTLRSNALGIEIRPSSSLMREEKRAVAAEAKRYGRFLGLPLSLLWRNEG